MNRLVHANRQFDDVETTWRALNGPFGPAAAAEGMRHPFCVDEVVFHLRRVAGELIGLLRVIQERANQGSWPRQVLVEGRGCSLPDAGRLANLLDEPRNDTEEVIPVNESTWVLLEGVSVGR